MLINAATQSVCEGSTDCSFIDLAHEIKFDDDEFYDNVHTTPKGAQRIGELLSPHLVTIVRRSPPS
jgi:lysophospholipase L1-like esterase